MVEASSLFRKSGFGDEDAANLALVAAMFQNVADTEISASDAAASIVSQLRAFGFGAEKATMIIDAYNEVANNFSVGTNDLSNAMEVASAGMATYGNEFESILGLVTAGTEIMVGRSAQVARGLNTIAGNVVKNKDVLAEYGIVVEDANGSLKSTFDVLSELKPKWDAMTEAERVAIGDTLAGTNQYKVLASVMSNFSQATAATETALNSSGSAMQENARYMESLAAQTNQLKATFQELSNQVIDNELVGSLLTLANDGLGSLDPKLVQTALLTGTLTGGLTIFGTVAGKLLVQLFSLGKSFGVLKAAIGTSTATMAMFSSVALPVAAIIAGITVAGYGMYKKWKENNPTIEEATEKIKGANEQLETNKVRLQELNDTPWFDRTPEIEKETAKIKAQNEELQKQIEYYTERNLEAAKEISTKEYDVYGKKSAYYHWTQGEMTGTKEQVMERIYSVYGSDSKYAEWLISGLKQVGEVAEESGDTLANSMTKAVIEYNAALENNGETSKEAIAIYNNNKETIDELANSYRVRLSLNDELTSAEQALLDAVDATTSAQEKARATIEFYNNNLILVDNTLKELTQTYPQLESVLEENNNVIGINYDKLGQLVWQNEETKKAVYDLIAAQTVFSNSDLDAKQKLEALGKLAAAAGVAGELIKNLGSDNPEYNKALQDLTSQGMSKEEAENSYLQSTWDKWISSIPSAVSPEFSGKTTGVTTAKLTDKALEDFKGYHQDLQHLRNMDAIDQETYLARLKELVADYTSDATAHMKEYGTDAKTIARNMYQYQEEQLESLKNLINQQFDDRISKLQKERDEEVEYWDEKIEALQKQNEAIEKQIQLETLQSNLKKAKAKKIFVLKDGMFQYSEDVDAISEALTNLESYQRQQALQEEVDNLKKLKAEALEAIDEQIEGWEEYKSNWSSLVAQYEDKQDELLEEQLLGIKLEGENWEERLNNLAEYVERYNNLLEKLGSKDEGHEKDEDEDEKDGSSKKLRVTPEIVDSVYRGDYGNGAERRRRLTEAGYDYETVQKAVQKKYYASGTLSASGGLSVVGEKGAELRVLNQGDGILPAGITKNLWGWGSINPKNFLGQMSGGLSFNNVNMSFPNVKNGADVESFVTGLKNLAYQRAFQRT